ncbi:MAG: ferrous iron transport protein B [Promethearchaeota archaeon]
MMSKGHKRRIQHRRQLDKREIRVALVGNPNTGKSVIFNSWTGLGAIVSNYPGTTVGILEGTVFLPYRDIFMAKWHPGFRDWDQWATKEQVGHQTENELESRQGPRGRGGRPLNRRWRGWSRRRHLESEEPHGAQLRIVDLPGSYTIISPSTDDERVTLRYLHEEHPDVIVNVIDATNLPRNLILTFALLEFDIPVLVCLNQMDLASRMGIHIDVAKLQRLLGVPVVPTVAIQGKNLKQVLSMAASTAMHRGRRRRPRRMIFPDGIEAKLVALEKQLVEFNSCPLDLPPRIVSQQILEGYSGCNLCLSVNANRKAVLELGEKLRQELEEEFGADVVLVLGEKKLDYANYIVERAQKGKGTRVPMTERISAVLTHRIVGLPIAILIVIGSLLLIFGVGFVFDETIGAFWDGVINPTIEAGIVAVVPWHLLQVILYYGFVLGIQGWLFIAVPYVATFYIILAIMEDSGYLARIAFLLDGIMHKVGLHGRAIIPLLLGMGCNVPAVLGTRTLNTRRERAIAGFLVVLVPCSAQLAVILGTVALYGSILFAFIIYGIVVGIIFGLGALLQHTLPGKSYGLVMEVPPLRLPRPKAILKKTWMRFKEFLYIALPLIIVGSAIIGVALDSGLLYLAIAPMSPLVVGWLGLPAITAAALLYGILRKELTVELLLVLGGGSMVFMTIRQMFVFALVTTIYVPCIATVAVLAREHGWKYTITLVLTTLTIALFLGGLVNILLIILGIP